VLTRRFTDIDIRRHGSGNIGATNVRRLAGNRLGLATLAADLLKGALPVCGVAVLFNQAGKSAPAAALALVALAAFAGHLYPVYTRFKGGGKGIATAAGGLLAMAPAAFAVCLAVFCLVLGASRRVSVGSLAAAGVMPVALVWATGSVWALVAILLMTVLIFVRHKDNLRRIRDGTEPRL
jgi:glycerol-3-phosphate acyltransferase PlsY